MSDFGFQFLLNTNTLQKLFGFTSFMHRSWEAQVGSWWFLENYSKFLILDFFSFIWNYHVYYPPWTHLPFLWASMMAIFRWQRGTLRWSLERWRCRHCWSWSWPRTERQKATSPESLTCSCPPTRSTTETSDFQTRRSLIPWLGSLQKNTQLIKVK